MISRKLERYNGFIIQHIDNKTKFEEKILSTSFLFLHSLANMLKFTSIVGYTSCGPTYIERFLPYLGSVSMCSIISGGIRHKYDTSVKSGVQIYPCISSLLLLCVKNQNLCLGRLLLFS